MKRFWDKVNKGSGVYGADGKYPTECWEWTGYKDTTGLPYGRFWYNGKMLRSHRVVWLLTYGNLDSNIDVLHKCDNASCVNPEHLFLGDAAINFRDMKAKGRHFVTNNRKLTEEQVKTIRKMYGTGEHSYRSLAKLFNLEKTQIGHIISREQWKETI